MSKSSDFPEQSFRNFNKIFQIGPSRCGTTSIHDFFLQNGLNSVHLIPDGGRYLVNQTISYNFRNNKPLLTYLENIDCFTDFFYYLPFDDVYFYDSIYNQYPNSKFIFNIRNIEDWLVSKQRLFLTGSKNPNGTLRTVNGLQFHSELDYLNHIKKVKKLNSIDEVIEGWRNDYYTKLSTAINYFESKQDDIVFFDIDTEKDKFITFMSKYLKLKNPTFPHSNKTIV